MTSVKIFENPEFGKVRVVDQNGEPWFAASDIAKALGYANPQEELHESIVKKSIKSPNLANRSFQ